MFVAASYSSKVDYDTGQVYRAYEDWLEGILGVIERAGYDVFCAVREDSYRINQHDPAAAFKLDIDNINQADVLLALLSDTVSAGVQSEIGLAVALHKKVILAHSRPDKLTYFNQSIVMAKVASELELPVTAEKLQKILG